MSETNRVSGSVPILLVCIPGTLCTGWSFEGLVRELGRKGFAVRSKVVDSSGFATARDVAKSAANQIDLVPGERLVIAGFSLGGIIAVQLALLCSDRLAGLILLDMNGEADRPENAANRRAAVARAGRSGVRTFILEETWPTHVSGANVGDLALRDAVVRMAEETGVHGFANQAEIAISRPRAIDAVSQIQAPILVLCGEEDRITPLSMSQAIAAAAPGSRLEIVKGAGHFAVFEKPEAIANTISTWLAVG